MKYFIALLICVMMIACKQSKHGLYSDLPTKVIRRVPTDTVIYSHEGATYHDVSHRLNEVCIRNVTYYMISYDRNGFMAPAFKPDGTLYTCK